MQSGLPATSAFRRRGHDHPRCMTCELLAHKLAHQRQKPCKSTYS